MVTRPVEGVVSPPMMLSSVLLPQPDGPIRLKSSPRAMSSVGALERNHPPRIPLRAEGLADTFDFDNRIAPIHFCSILRRGSSDCLASIQEGHDRILSWPP